MPQKRRGGGRVTPSKKARAALSAETGSPVQRSGPARGTAHDHTPEPSGRYTPPKADYRLRPGWHRIVGWLGVAVGVLIAVLNDGMFFTETHLLPFGHSEFYLMLALLVAGSSSWFLGLFDRGTTIFE